MSAAPTRRTLLGGAGIAAAALVVAPAAVAATAPHGGEIEETFAAWRRLQAQFTALPDDAPDRVVNPMWVALDRAEAAILNAPGATPRLAVMRLWIGLHHSLGNREHCSAAARCDLPWLLARADALDWHDRLFLNALAAIEGQPGVSYRSITEKEA